MLCPCVFHIPLSCTKFLHFVYYCIDNIIVYTLLCIVLNMILSLILLIVITTTTIIIIIIIIYYYYYYYYYNYYYYNYYYHNYYYYNYYYHCCTYCCKAFADDKEIIAMSELRQSLEANDLARFERTLKAKQNRIVDEPFLMTYIYPLRRRMREQVAKLYNFIVNGPYANF